MLVDTDVLIWYLKGNENARRFIEKLPKFFISSVTYIELVQGMRNKQELLFLRRALKTLECKNIAYLRRDFDKSGILR